MTPRQALRHLFTASASLVTGDMGVTVTFTFHFGPVLGPREVEPTSNTCPSDFYCKIHFINNKLNWVASVMLFDQLDRQFLSPVNTYIWQFVHFYPYPHHLVQCCFFWWNLYSLWALDDEIESKLKCQFTESNINCSVNNAKSFNLNFTSIAREKVIIHHFNYIFTSNNEFDCYFVHCFITLCPVKAWYVQVAINFTFFSIVTFSFLLISFNTFVVVTATTCHQQ